MTPQEEFTKLSSALALKMADELDCQECGGAIIIPWHCDTCAQGPSEQMCSETYDSLICEPCPSCSPERYRLQALAKRLCWHEPNRGPLSGPNELIVYTCKFCGELISMAYSRPTYSNPVDIVAVMKELGVLEGFVEWLARCEKCGGDGILLYGFKPDYIPKDRWTQDRLCDNCDGTVYRNDVVTVDKLLLIADILLTPALLLEAALAFMKSLMKEETS
jgi:hypothetical protein